MKASRAWLPANFELAGGGLACIGLGEDGSTYLESCLLDPSAKAQQPEHTDFSAAHRDGNANGVRGMAARMEQLAVHALLVQLHVLALVSEGAVPPASGGKGFGGGPARGGSGEPLRRPVWLGKDYQLQRQPGDAAGSDRGVWRRGHWRPLSPLTDPVAPPLEWVEPVHTRG